MAHFSIRRLLGLGPPRHKSAKRSAARRKYGLTPRQKVLKAEREKRKRGAESLFYEGREGRYHRLAEAGFPKKKSSRKTARKLRQYSAIRATMRQGYGKR